ncbi:MAG: hypothetical protein RLZZ28_1323 [Bacteroidota bacterium]|jgi:hypothetical protein
MQEANRDLLLMSKIERLSNEEQEWQIAFLNQLLYHTENWPCFCVANELIDINHHRIIRKPYLIQQRLSEKNQRAFVFVFNKN